MSYLNSCDVCIVPAARRRLRRKAHRERWSEEEGWPALPAAYTEKWPALRDPPTGCSEDGSGPPDGNYCAIASDASGLSTPATIVGTSTQPVSDGPPRDHEPETPPAISRRVLAAIERVWDLEQNPDPDCNIDDWDIANPNESKIGRAAEHAALLLDVFSRVKPVDDSQLTTVQKGLIAKALSSILEITQHIRVLAATASIPLEPLPVADDPALSVYLGCVVCYARVSDMLMMPCRHLTLCEVRVWTRGSFGDSADGGAGML